MGLWKCREEMGCCSKQGEKHEQRIGGKTEDFISKERREVLFDRDGKHFREKLQT